MGGGRGDMRGGRGRGAGMSQLLRPPQSQQQQQYPGMAQAAYGMPQAWAHHMQAQAVVHAAMFQQVQAAQAQQYAAMMAGAQAPGLFAGNMAGGYAGAMGHYGAPQAAWAPQPYATPAAPPLPGQPAPFAYAPYTGPY